MKKILLALSFLMAFLLCACSITVSPAAPSEKPSVETPQVSDEPTQTPTQEVSPSPGVVEPTAESETAGMLGTVDGSSYINAALGFSGTVPEGWEVADEEGLSTLFGMSADLLKETTGLEPESQRYIFYCSKYGIGYTDLNPNINIVVSNQNQTMMLMANEDVFNSFIEQYRPMLEQLYGGAEVELSGEMNVKAGDGEYSAVHSSVNLNGVPIMQDQYFIISKGYALIITLTYFDEADKPTLDTFLAGLQYE